MRTPRLRTIPDPQTARRPYAALTRSTPVSSGASAPPKQPRVLSAWQLPMARGTSAPVALGGSQILPSPDLSVPACGVRGGFPLQSSAALKLAELRRAARRAAGRRTAAVG